MSDLPLRLELLVPWELPIEQPLIGSDRVRVERALQQLLQALQQADEAALSLVHQALLDLGTVTTTPVRIAASKTPLKQFQIAEFDAYFEAVHVQSADAAACLVQSLLVVYQRLLELWLQSDQLDPNQFALDQVNQQKQGLISYVFLLGRVFHLDLPQEESHGPD
jgi:adenine-specific DNA glycosylase